MLRSSNRSRRGSSAVGAAVVVALIAIAAVAMIRGLGSNTSNDLNTSATNFSDPATLSERWETQGK